MVKRRVQKQFLDLSPNHFNHDVPKTSQNRTRARRLHRWPRSRRSPARGHRARRGAPRRPWRGQQRGGFGDGVKLGEARCEHESHTKGPATPSPPKKKRGRKALAACGMRVCWLLFPTSCLPKSGTSSRSFPEHQ